jgi:hypothetical protein
MDGINTNRSWIWLALIVLVYAAWKFWGKPWVERKNKKDK